MRSRCVCFEKSCAMVASCERVNLWACFAQIGVFRFQIHERYFFLRYMQCKTVCFGGADFSSSRPVIRSRRLSGHQATTRVVIEILVSFLESRIVSSLDSQKSDITLNWEPVGYRWSVLREILSGLGYSLDLRIYMKFQLYAFQNARAICWLSSNRVRDNKTWMYTKTVCFRWRRFIMFRAS